jgi:hypothetical protein
MARPWFSVEGDSLQMWIVAVNILKKQIRAAEKGWFSQFGIWAGGDNKSSPQENSVLHPLEVL